MTETEHSRRLTIAPVVIDFPDGDELAITLPRIELSDEVKNWDKYKPLSSALGRRPLNRYERRRKNKNRRNQ